MLKTQLEKVRQDAARVIQIEPAIAQLQRTRELQETNYRYYASSLEQARVHESLGAGKITNIIVVQTPSPAGRAWTGAMRPVALILVLGFLAGPALAFVRERILDQTLKRVPDLERYLRLPVFLSIPKTSRNGRVRSFRIFGNGHHRRQTGSASAEGVQSRNGQSEQAEVAPWDPQHSLRLYCEALRDRLITYFEVRNMTHRPKLVAITSCNRRAGVTTLAAGLAATLSETGDGNVLLVDMNLEQGAAHQFHKGKPRCGLSEALENAKPDTALVHDHLYLVSAHESNNQKLPRVLPKRFAHLVPKMKASDYDYIIFDMPPVTQTSVTPRLSGFMDFVLLVLESERTGQEIANRAKALLDESGANMAAVLNKHRSYVPQRLSQEL
jgi:Mrp family chromosome partitioning ATPase